MWIVARAVGSVGAALDVVAASARINPGRTAIIRYRIIRYRYFVNRGGCISFLAYIAELHRAVHAIGLYLGSQVGADVSQPEALIIMFLSGRSTATINEVHRAFLHRRSTLTSVLDRMQDKKLIKRSAAPDDRRSIVVSLTPRGIKVARKIETAIAQLDGRLEASQRVSAHDAGRVRTLADLAMLLAAEDGDDVVAPAGPEPAD